MGKRGFELPLVFVDTDAERQRLGFAVGRGPSERRIVEALAADGPDAEFSWSYLAALQVLDRQDARIRRLEGRLAAIAQAIGNQFSMGPDSGLAKLDGPNVRQFLAEEEEGR